MGLTEELPTWPHPQQRQVDTPKGGKGGRAGGRVSDRKSAAMTKGDLPHWGVRVGVHQDWPLNDVGQGKDVQLGGCSQVVLGRLPLRKFLQRYNSGCVH